MDDLDLVLVAPDGRAMTLIGDVGGVNGLDGWVEIGAFGFGGMTGPLAPYSDTSIDPEVERGLPTDFDTTPGDADAFPGAAPASFVPLFGTDVSGVWTLHAYDDTTGNVGSVTGWSIRLTYGITASPSPSTLVVSGTPQVVTDVDLMLHDVDSGHLSDTEVVLESPDGRYAHVLSDAGGSAVADLDMALDDEAGADIPESETPAAGGSYRPRNYDGGDASEPLGGVETIAMDARLSIFDGGPATGTWKLWLFQECCGASSAIASWSLRITTADPPPTPASVVSDTTAPVLSGVRLRPGLLPTGEGARLKVTSSERASLAGVVQRRRDGKWQAVGTKRWSLAAGANTRTFYGKTSERRLGPARTGSAWSPPTRPATARPPLDPLPRRPRLTRPGWRGANKVRCTTTRPDTAYQLTGHEGIWVPRLHRVCTRSVLTGRSGSSAAPAMPHLT